MLNVFKKEESYSIIIWLSSSFWWQTYKRGSIKYLTQIFTPRDSLRMQTTTTLRYTLLFLLFFPCSSRQCRLVNKCLNCQVLLRLPCRQYFKWWKHVSTEAFSYAVSFLWYYCNENKRVSLYRYLRFISVLPQYL